ncbi:hypothetical protein EDD22DRAFT_850442 [Suillus occidentalis]|nr:hypothetical protein EDD22DRAFT_850442 [Suillus occidentalis]
MTFISNDPNWWPLLDSNNFFGYWIVAAGFMIVYDWVLTLGQEIELIWIRYIGILYSVSSLTISGNVLETMMFVSLTDAGCNMLYYAMNWTNVVITAMLGGSRTMLIFLVIIFLAVNIACVVFPAIGLKNVVAEELILSGMHICSYSYEGNTSLLVSTTWIVNTVWEVLALCLSVWIAVKHFRDMRRLGPSTGSTIGDCFRVLIQSHVLYFASFAGVSCFQLIGLAPAFANSNFTAAMIFGTTRVILAVVQMFLLGPRLILSVREYHAKLVAGSDADTSMNSIVFQEHVHISTSGTV